MALGKPADAAAAADILVLDSDQGSSDESILYDHEGSGNEFFDSGPSACQRATQLITDLVRECVSI
jgi:hypothetical protein